MIWLATGASALVAVQSSPPKTAGGVTKPANGNE